MGKTAYEKCLDLDAHWYEWYQCIEMGYELYMSCEHDLKGQQNPGECIHKLFSGDLQWIGGSLHGGMHLNDVIAEVWPFRAADVGIGYKEPGTVLTNADMVCFMSPEHAPYTYDNFPNGEHEVLV